MSLIRLDMNTANKLSLKIFFSVLIFYFVLTKIETEELINTFSKIEIPYIIFSYLSIIILFLLFVLKWRIFLKKASDIKFIPTLSIYWAADFVNLFSLGVLGSEAYKAFSFDNKKMILFTSLLDRFYSLIWYILFLLCIIIPYVCFNDPIFIFCTAIFLYVTSVVIIVVLGKQIEGLPLGLIKNEFINKLISNSSYKAYDLIVHAIYSTGIIIFHALAYSLIFQAVGIPAKFVELLIFMPILIVAITLPISFDGIGMREFLFFQFAKINSQDPEIVLTASISVYMFFLFHRIAGMLPFILRKGLWAK